ncbi:MAG: hypothetical protein E7121_08320 [Bacteroidales bacterium]|nr:hypothetical protein [Bacteroidales bacterium]MBQ6872646.1 bifunctional nuclease family protein [Bacteroidales bacterium]
MKRVRLDIGALAASAEDGGSFTFFLYREGLDKCLPVPLTPPEMHAMLSNFKQEREELTIQRVFSKVLQEYRVELLEVAIIRRDELADGVETGQEETDGGFLSELLLFDGEREIRQVAGFADGIILSKQFGAPIYIAEALMDKYAKGMDSYSKDVLDSEAMLKNLKEALQEAIANEEYERASQISRQIEELKRGRKKEEN